jgi:hypothetical protein
MRKLLMALLLPALLLIAFGINSGQRSVQTNKIPLRAGLSRSDRITVDVNQTNLAQALIMYSELTGRTQLPKTTPISQQLDEFFGGYLSRWHFVRQPPRVSSGIEYHRDGLFTVGELKDHLESLFAANGFVLVPEGKKNFRVVRSLER